MGAGRRTDVSWEPWGDQRPHVGVLTSNELAATELAWGQRGSASFRQLNAVLPA